MADGNKVRFGLSGVAFGTYTVASDGTVTLGSKVDVKGAVNLTLDPESAESTFWADNQKYLYKNQDNGYTGTLEMAKFPDTFKTSFMNYVPMTGGGVGEVKTMSNKAVYMIFEVQGDVQARRTIVYNIELGRITANPSTQQDTIEPTTESLALNVIGDNKTGLVQASYETGDSAYATLYSNPPVPALPAES